MSTISTVVFLTTDYWEAVLRLGGPIALAATAAVLCARAGVLYVGIEGAMLASAFFAIAGVVWTGSIFVGVLLGVASGVVVNLLLGMITMNLRMGDVVGGLVIVIGATGVTGFLLREWFPEGASIGAERLGPVWPSPGGGIVEVFLHQHPLIYITILAVAAMIFFLRTGPGLVTRASGESIRVAEGLGVNLIWLRMLVLAAAGVLIGLAGAALSLAVIGTFNTNIVDGRGFIALACVILGGWTPIGAVIAAFAFGAANAFQFQADIGGLGEWVRLLPYVLVLVAMLFFWGRVEGPAEVGRDLPGRSPE